MLRRQLLFPASRQLQQRGYSSSVLGRGSALASRRTQAPAHLGNNGRTLTPALSSVVRVLSSFSAMDRYKLEELRSAIRANGGADEKKLREYLRLLSSVSPKDAIQEISAGWDNGKFPVDEFFVREYLKAASALGKMDSVNISGILDLMRRGAVSAVGGAGGRGFNAFESGGSRFGLSAGGSPNEPLYVTNPEPSFKSQAWKLAKSALVIFMLLSFTSAVLDDFKGGAGGLGARMGMGSVIHQAEHSDKTFNDVVGIDEAKGELEEIVQYLKDPKRFTRLGGKLPKGVLLTGPPGTGKTLLARAIAGEAGVPFFHSSGSEFEEMYVGVGARRVRELFEAAKSKSPCIIFIDEIDAIGGSRKEKDQSAMKMTLNQLLVEMDGFEQNTGVIVIAATNFPNSLDAALVRPGRFDKQVDVPMPDIGGRKAILDLYLKKIPLTGDVDTEQIARGTPGFSGAELFNLVNQAAVRASVSGAKAVSMGQFEYAKDKIMMGAERKSAIISPETMRMTAFHEAGHALVALKTDGADPIHKATIMPRGRALGMVMQLPDGDHTSYSRKQMLARLDVCMGGRVAEEVVYGFENVTSGASSDIQQATRLAKAMVTKYGLSDKVGIMFLDDKEKSSGDTQRDVDSEVRALLTDSYARAKKILTTNRRELDLIAHGLLEHESLSGQEVADLAQGVQPNLAARSQKPSRPLTALPLNKKGGDAKGSAPAQGKATPAVKPTPAPAPAAAKVQAPAPTPAKQAAAPAVPASSAPVAASVSAPASVPASVSPAAAAAPAAAASAPVAPAAGGAKGGFFSSFFSSSGPSSSSSEPASAPAQTVTVPASAPTPASAPSASSVAVSTAANKAQSVAQAQAQAQAKAQATVASSGARGPSSSSSQQQQQQQQQQTAPAPPRGPPKQ